jgi:Protein of unknown function (DUF2799)
MSSRIAGLSLVLVALATSGCASMSSNECAMSDWSAVGFEDGASGYTSERFSSRRKACAKHGIKADFRAYQEGRDEGLVQFCQPSRGYNLGVRGGTYNGVCDAALEEEFLDAYRVGNQLYILRSNVGTAKSRIASKERELDRIETDIRSKEATVIAADTTTENRVLLLADLKRLSEHNGELEAEIDQLIRDRARFEHELASYENTVAAYGF